jgi:hypothetical protein
MDTTRYTPEDSLRYDTPYVEPTPAFYSGASTSPLVPYPFPVAVAGHPYQIQWDSTAVGVWGGKFKKTSLPLLRTQADNSNTPGEQSVSPEQFWRRSQDSWNFGAGQVHYDRANSNGNRFYTSKGVNPWDQWKVSLLNTTSNVKTSTNTGLQCLVAGTYVYLIDSTALRYSSGALSSWSSVTGMTGSPLSMASDGNTVYTANGTNGIYSGTVGGASVSSYATHSVSMNLVRFTKSRLMAAGGGHLFNVTSAGTISGTEILLDLSTRNFTWVDIVGGQSQIYAAGYAGDKSLVYRTAIKADGTALDVPIVAAELPDGEIVASLGEYLGYILIGSNRGVRFCSVNSDGSLTLGSLTKTDATVYCFEGQDRFVWYGLTNYDISSTGLGRLDLTAFTSTLTPAYASDLMADTQGAVRSVQTFNNYRLFTVDGVGLYYETANTPVSTGSITIGTTGYGINDPKVAMFLDIKHQPLTGSISFAISADGKAAKTIGISSVTNSVSPANAFPCRQLFGEEFQLTATLTPESNVSPVLTRWTLRSYPAPIRTGQWDIPILLFDTVSAGGTDYAQDVTTELDFLIGLHKSQKIATLQIGNTVSQAVMYDYQWLPEAFNTKGYVRGTFYAQFREIAG